MEDKELDQMLKKALIPNIKDNETKIRFEMEDCVMRKQKKILKPVVALADCAALVIGISYGNVTEKIIGTHMLSSESDNSATGKTEDIKNCFSVKVKAAEVQKLERGKETAVITQKELGSGGWSGTDSTKEISYVIESPIVCEGKQIDTITYSLSHGSFGVIQPKENPCVLEGTECDTDEGKYCDFNIEPKGASKVKLMKKSYSSFTISAKDQQKVVIYLRDNKKVSGKLYNKVWNSYGDDEKSLDVRTQGMNDVLDNLVMTCKITYRDGTSETADIAVKKKIMTYKEAYSGKKTDEKIKQLADEKDEFTTFELQ